MDRQARLKGSENWVSFGDVTHLRAGELLCAGAVVNPGDIIETRCMDHPETIHELEYRGYEIRWVVKPLRKDGDE